MKRKIIIYRHQLFKYSEPFIAQQAQLYTDHIPIYVGRKILGEPPSRAEVITLEGRCNFTSLLRHVLFRDSSSFLKCGLKDKDPVLLHSHFGVEGVYALPLAKKLKIPLVTTFHGYDVTTTKKGLLLSGKVSWVNYLAFRKELMKEGDLFICVSNYLRERLINMGFPDKRVITHYIGVDAAKIRPNFKGKESKIILHVGRLVEKKGTKYLLQAFKKVAGHDKDSLLVIVGDGPLKNELIEQARNYGLQDRVTFRGALPHSEVMKLMQDAIMLVQPSVKAKTGDSEGLGIVLLEASASGIPVVGTWHGGIPEAIIDGVTGFLVPERNASALAEKLLTLLSEDSLREKMGYAGRKMVEERFDIKNQSKILEDIYRRLL